MYTVCETVKFEAAHRLTDSYSKECQNIHGHSYRVDLIVSSSILQRDVVMDFGDLKDLFHQCPSFDHSIILHDDDQSPILAINNAVYVNFNPTAKQAAFERAVTYVKEHPWWRLSLQTQKMLRIQ